MLQHRYCNSLILMTLAAHIGEIERIPENARSKERPVGALVLSIQAVCKLIHPLFITHYFLKVERALKLYATGKRASAKAANLWFSKDNWGDIIKYEDGQARQIRRATKYLKVINDFDDERWSLILNSAKEHYQESQPREKGQSVAQPIEVEDDDDYFIVSD